MLHPIQMLQLLLSPLVTPTVSSFGPPSMVVDVDENGRVQFECMAAGPPEPTFLVKKTKPAPGLWESLSRIILITYLKSNLAHKEERLILAGA